MFDGQKREFECDRVGCGNTAGAPDGVLPKGWHRLSQDVMVKGKTVHHWYSLCPLCTQLLSVTM